MSSINNIKKITYSDNRDSIVTLKEYILFKDEAAKKQLCIFKFQNNLNQQLSKMTFNVMQYDSDHFMIKKSMVNYEDFIIDRGEAFVPKLKMELDIFCETIEIELTYAKFERVEFIDGVLKPILYTHTEFIGHKEEVKKPSKKEQKLLEKQRVKEIKRNSKETDKRKIEVNDVISRNKPLASAVFTLLLSLCLIVFVIATVTYIGLNSKLFNKGDYMYEKVDGNNVYIHKYYGKDSVIEVPLEIDNYKITGIDKKAFKNTNITSISFTSPIVIESNAFEGCKELNKIENTQFINSIGNCAFKDCISLTKFESNDVDTIGVKAFENCSSLSLVNVPNATVDSEAFLNDLNLTKLTIKDTQTTQFSSLFGSSNNLTSLKIFRKRIESGYFLNMKKLKNLEFGYAPNIEFGALEDTNLDNHYINNTVETLNGKIIAIRIDDNGLITLPKSITDKEQAFEFLSNYRKTLKAIQTEMSIEITSEDILPFEGLTGFGVMNNGLVNHYIISDNNNIETIYWDSNSSINNVITLPQSVDTICFGINSTDKKIINKQLYNLDDYNILKVVAKNVKQIVDGAFDDLKCIDTLEIDNYGEINLYDLDINSSLQNLIIKNTDNKALALDVDDYNNLSYIEFPNNITDLNASIRNCLNLYNIYIPENVINIGSNFISNCGVSNIKFNSNINSIGNNFIDSCENIQEIILPSSLKKIGNNAFVNCPNLYYIELPNGLQTVGSRLINNNITLATLILPNSITSMELPVIGNNCNVNTIYTPFVGLNASTSRTYNDFNRSAVTTFALYVYGNLDVNQAFFNNLTNLNTFAVDGVVKGLGNKVFMYATNLQNIKFKGDFSCKFNELFNGITSLNDVVISGNFDLSDNFFNNMSINSLAVNSYNYIFNEAFTNSSINRAFLGKNGNLDAFSKRGFFDKALNYVTLMYLGIELTDIAREYSNVSSTTYTYFLQNYTIFD